LAGLLYALLVLGLLGCARWPKDRIFIDERRTICDSESLVFEGLPSVINNVSHGLLYQVDKDVFHLRHWWLGLLYALLVLGLLEHARLSRDCISTDQRRTVCLASSTVVQIRPGGAHEGSPTCLSSEVACFLNATYQSKHVFEDPDIGAIIGDVDTRGSLRMSFPEAGASPIRRINVSSYLRSEIFQPLYGDVESQSRSPDLDMSSQIQ